MARLTPAEISSRRALDYRVVHATNGNGVLGVSAHQSLADLEMGRPITDAAGLRGEAKYYLAAYYFPVLIGAGKTTDRVLVSFDVSGDGYPYREPRAMVLSRPLPWSPHVHPGNGTVCIGEAWIQGRGRMLLAQLMVHVARILNGDEPDRGPDYVGWNPAASRHWRTVLCRQPLTPGLAYPVPPVDITHGLTQATDDSFAPVNPEVKEPEAHFSPVSLEAQS